MTPVPEQGRILPSNPHVVFPKEEIEQSIGSRFEKQVERYPKRTALTTPTAELTYTELNAWANRVARAILCTCPQSTKPIALLLAKGETTLASVFGTLKTGRPYVPLDLSFGARRNRSMIVDSRADVLITDHEAEAHVHEIADTGIETLYIDDIPASMSACNLDISIAPEAIAYILYTSGSTGVPKGVFQNHRNVLHGVMKTTNRLHIDSSDRLLQLASFSFASSVSDVFPALLNGAGLYPYNLRKRGLTRLKSWITDNSITVYHSVPTVFRGFMAAVGGSDDFSGVRLVKLGGEPVLRRDFEVFRKRFAPGCVLHVNYGSTEMNGIRHFFATHDTRLDGATLPIGYETPDTKVSLLDDNGQEVGIGSEGEIVIASPYLALGYWRNPDQTNARFQAHPSDPAVRCYRTGDIGKMAADGCLMHLGRKDLQVKIRGYRVEIAEIELALAEIEQVQEAAVVAQEVRGGDKMLVAYLVASGRPQPSGIQLRDHLKRRLPEYMVPSLFRFVESLPLTATGKVDRLALPEPR